MYKIQRVHSVYDDADEYVPNGYEGNVNLLSRPHVSSDTMHSKGWMDIESGDYATLYTCTYSIGNTSAGFDFACSFNAIINLTPIFANGSVYSENELTNYLSSLASASGSKTQLLTNDKNQNGLLLSVKVVSVDADLEQEYAEAGAWAEDLHELQAEWDERVESHELTYDTIYDQDDMDSSLVTGPKCSLEIGEAGSLQFTLLPSHPLIDYLYPVSTFVRLLDGEDEIFFGKILQRSDPVASGKVTFTCSGALSFLMDSEVSPFEKNSSGQAITQHWSAETFFRWCIDQHNADIDDPRRAFTVGTISADKKDTEADYQISSYTQTKSAIESNIINVYGGYLRTRREIETLYIDWIQEYDTEDAQPIELGNNLIDQTTQIDGTSFYTVIRPTGKDGVKLTEGTIDLFNEEDMKRYGRIVKTIQFNTATNETDLRTQANDYKDRIQKMLFADVDVRFIDMHYLDGTTPKIRIGNKFTNIHGMEGIEMIAASLSLNLDAPQNDSAALKNRRSLEGDLTPEGNLHSGKTMSGSSRKSSGQFFKHLKETGETLEVTAKQVYMHGETLTQHYNQITTTANTVLTLSRRADTTEQTLAPISEQWASVQVAVTKVEGSAVLSDDYNIANIVGKFEIGQTPGGRTIVRLKDGADLQVSDESGVTQTVGERLGTYNTRIDNVEYYVDLFTGSALWTQRDGITGVAGQFEVEVDPLTGKKILVIKSGGGMKIRRDNVEYGLYDDGNLTGGILVEKLNAEGPVVTQIRGDIIDLSTNNGYTNILMTTTNIATEVSYRARVYVQVNDPAVQYGSNKMHEGDFWIKSLKVQNWNDMQNRNWTDAGSFDWNQYAGAPQYIWDGSRWEEVGDQGKLVEWGTRIDQNERHIELVARAIEGVEAVTQSSIEVTADAIVLAVNTAKSEIYSVIRQTSTNIIHEVGNDIDGVSSVIEQTSCSLASAIALKNKVYIQMTDPVYNAGVTLKDGDIWIRSVANNNIRPTWSELSAKSWTSQNGTNWREYYSGAWFVRQNDEWRPMREDADVVEIGTKLEQEIDHIALIARNVDENHIELGARLNVTATEIRGEVHAAKSTLYSVIEQTATRVFSGVYDTVAGNFSTIEQTSTAIRLAVTSAKSSLYSVIEQTSTYVYSGVYDKVTQNFSTITQTASAIKVAVASGQSALYNSMINVTSRKIEIAVESGKSDLYKSLIAVTSTNIVMEVADAKSNLSSYVNETASGIYSAVAKKNKVYIQMTNPVYNIDADIKEGDIWIQTVGNNSIKPSWSELSAKSWASQSNTNWRNYYSNAWFVWQNGGWKPMREDADVVEIGTMLEKEIDHIALVARDVDKNHIELGARLNVTATEIRGEVHAAKSNLYSVIEQTATRVFSGVYDTVAGNFSTIEQTSSQIRIAVSASKSDLYSSIVATASSIRQEVGDKESQLRSAITVQSNRINLVVEGTGSNARIRPAAIVAAVNNGQSELSLGADVIEMDATNHVKLSGVFTINTSGSFPASVQIKAPTIIMGTAARNMATYADGQITANEFFYKDGTTQTTPGLLKKAAIEGNTLKIWKFGDTEANPSITFSKATTLSGEWGSGTNVYTVTAKQNNVTVGTNTVSPVVHVELPGSQPSANVKVYVATPTSGGSGYSDHGSATTLYLVKNDANVLLRSVNSVSGGYTYAQTAVDWDLAWAGYSDNNKRYSITGGSGSSTNCSMQLDLNLNGTAHRQTWTAPVTNAYRDGYEQGYDDGEDHAPYDLVFEDSGSFSTSYSPGTILAGYDYKYISGVPDSEYQEYRYIMFKVGGKKKAFYFV